MTKQDTVDRDRDRERERIAVGRLINWDEEATLGAVFFGPEKSDQFPPLLVGTVETLFQNGYVHPNERHNDAPSASRLHDWAMSTQQRYKHTNIEVGLIGYMVSPKREDSRIRFTGISIRSPIPLPKELQREATREFDPDLLVVDDFDIQLKWN